MRRIDLTPYVVTARDEEGKPVTQDYPVKESLVEMAFIPQDGCRGSELLKRSALAQKIEQATGDSVLLEQAEWQRLIDALNSGAMKLGKWQVELVRRVIEAPDVPVQEVVPTTEAPSG